MKQHRYLFTLTYIFSFTHYRLPSYFDKFFAYFTATAEFNFELTYNYT